LLLGLSETNTIGYYILLFIHLGTREVHVAGFTPHPDQQWMIQIARHVTVADWGFLAPRQYLIHDRDGKCCPAFQHLIDDAAVQRIVLPPQSPNLNAYAERWVRSVKDEVLSRLILFGEPSLRHTLSQYTIVSYEESGMPVDFLTEAERERWQRLPDTIPQDDLLVFFLLSDDDRRETQRQRAPQNRLSYALQLCILRYLDFVPDDLQAPSHEAVTFVAEQLEMDRVCSPSRHRRAPVRRRQSQSQPGEMAGPDWLEIDEPALATHAASQALSRLGGVFPAGAAASHGRGRGAF
jgi:hypothetical protein